MRSIAVGGILAAAAIALTGCASAGSGAPVAPDAPEPLTELPAPSTDSPALAIATVLERERSAVLCVGPVAESAPPQCDGPELVGWDWDAFEHEETGGVRWTQGVAVEGTYDAAAFAFTQVGAPTSAAAITLPAVEVPAGELDEARIAAVQAELMALERRDVLSAGGQDGIVVLDVVYDDGSMQAVLDDHYGEGTVFVVSALRG